MYLMNPPKIKSPIFFLLRNKIHHFIFRYYAYKLSNSRSCPGRGQKRLGVFTLTIEHSHSPNWRIQAERTFRQELINAARTQPFRLREIYNQIRLL